MIPFKEFMNEAFKETEFKEKMPKEYHDKHQDLWHKRSLLHRLYHMPTELHYSGQGSWDVNTALGIRSGLIKPATNLNLIKDYSKRANSVDGKIAALDRIFKRHKGLAGDVDVYRGVRGSEKKAIDQLAVNDIHQSPGFSSSSLSPSSAIDFAEAGQDNVHTIVHYPLRKGDKHALPISSKMHEEAEVLQNRNRKYRVTNIEHRTVHDTRPHTNIDDYGVHRNKQRKLRIVTMEPID